MCSDSAPIRWRLSPAFPLETEKKCQDSTIHRKYSPDSFPSPANLARSNRASFLTFAGRSSKDPKSPRNKLVNTCVMIIFLMKEDRGGNGEWKDIYFRLSIVPKFSTILSNDDEDETKERKSCLTLFNESKLSMNSGLGITSELRQYFSIVRTLTLREKKKSKDLYNDHSRHT